MKTKFRSLLIALALLAGIHRIAAQGTTFMYQGQLSDGGQPANGTNYGMVFYLYDAATNGDLLGNEGIVSVTVSNGLFTVPLNFGNEFDGTPRWLEITVQKNGGAFTTLSPRQAITPTPYAMFANTASNALTATTASAIGGVGSANVAQLNVPNTTVPATGSVTVTSGFITGATLLTGGSGYTSPPSLTVNDVSGSNAVVTCTVSGGAVTGLTVQTAGIHYSGAATLTIAPPPSDAYQTFNSGNFFNGVNTMTNPANALGGAFNGTVSGSGGGLTNVNAATLGGLAATNFWKTGGNGGTTAGVNFVGTTDSQPLELHVNNLRALRLESTSSSGPNVIGGYSGNLVSAVWGATIGGGGTTNYINHISSFLGTVSGGSGNIIQGGANDSTIGGGRQNTIDSGSWGAFIGGGHGNWIQSGDNPGSGSSVNTSYAVIAGGFNNTIQSNSYDAVIGGGYANLVQSNSFRSAIVGGSANVIQTNAAYAMIGCGLSNMNGGSYSFLGGGSDNAIQPPSTNSFIGGGLSNRVSGQYTTLSGGLNNTVSGSWSSVGGGKNNAASGDAATVGGGLQNQVGGFEAVVAGGYANSAPNEFSTIGGGAGNQTQGAWSTVGGGDDNLAQGYSSAIGGGTNNLAGGYAATTPGGFANAAVGDFSFAAGQQSQALHQGTFVWADSQNSPFASTASNQFLIRAQGGMGLNTNNPQGVALNVNGSIAASGSVTANGVLLTSDRRAKENFTTFDSQSILAKVAALPLTQWNYKTDSKGVQHIGPMAQDFQAAFQLNGGDDKHISVVDESGVALAAIQGLNQKLELEARNKDAEIQDLKQSVAELKNLVQSLARPQPASNTP